MANGQEAKKARYQEGLVQLTRGVWSRAWRMKSLQKEKKHRKQRTTRAKAHFFSHPLLFGQTQSTRRFFETGEFSSKQKTRAQITRHSRAVCSCWTGCDLECCVFVCGKRLTSCSERGSTCCFVEREEWSGVESCVL